jgi:hypothetical protein
MTVIIVVLFFYIPKKEPIAVPSGDSRSFLLLLLFDRYGPLYLASFQEDHLGEEGLLVETVGRVFSARSNHPPTDDPFARGLFRILHHQNTDGDLPARGLWLALLSPRAQFEGNRQLWTQLERIVETLTW